MTPERADPGAARILDASALGLFAAHAALRLSLRGGDGSWGANLVAHLLVPLSAAVWLAARALERRLPWRLTGFEIPLVSLAALSLITSFGASFRLGALDGAAGLCAAALSIPLAVHLFGPSGRNGLYSVLISIVTVVVVYGAIQYVQLGELQDDPRVRHAEDGEFAGRAGAREPWSTFNGYPNTFGGFLVLAIPFAIGVAVDSKSLAVRGILFFLAALGVFDLSRTGATGAWVAAWVGGMALALLVVMRRRPDWKKPILIACGAAVVLVGAIAVSGPLSPKALAKRSEAIAIRDVYWDAAVHIARDHHFGVGMNNFADHYYDHKDDRQEEVTQVHNDYLQILVELGVLGLAAFAGLLVIAGFKALGPPASEPSGPLDAFRLPLGIGLVAGWLAAFGFQGAFGDATTALVLAAAGGAVYWLALRKADFGDFARIGLVAGLAGAAVHFLVDFDLPDPAFRHYFFLSLGALALVSRLEPPSTAGIAVPAAGAVVLFLIALPLAGWVAPRFLEADDLVTRAEISRSEADLHLEAAAEANPLDAGPVYKRAMSEYHRWMAKGEIEATPENNRPAELAIAFLEEALRRRPRSAAIEARLAEVNEAFSRRLERAASGIDAAFGEGILRQAERHARRAVELYPTSAYHRYLLGRILEGSGQTEAATAEFREALRLSALAKRVPRLSLDGIQAAFATLKTGGSREQAVAMFVEWRRAHPGWRSRLPYLAPGEKSIVDAAPDSK
ncbi:MAG TPA: O-antigen ligase family protein [Planctomycetota bacterium]|nr:O-antigen ligase family protein [Planctomycetota bacterium]